MNRRLLWKLCLIIAFASVVLFYFVGILSTRTEEAMSMLSEAHKQELNAYAQRAEALYLAGDTDGLQAWMADIQQRENTWVAIVESEITAVAGSELNDYFYKNYGIGRGVRWMLHPWLINPLMELKFVDKKTHFLIRLPDRMHPSMFEYMGLANLALWVVLPLFVLMIVAYYLYRHIMSPLRLLEAATRQFSHGRFDIRLQELMGNRSDELTELVRTFDNMAARISDLIISQRQLISDLSHELRTPLARLDVAVSALKGDQQNQIAIERVEKESAQIRKLMEDTLTLAWLENERPNLNEESLDLVDLLDVVVDDARFEFPDRKIAADFPDYAPLARSNHRSLGQALENIIRNAMRFTPPNKTVSVSLLEVNDTYQIDIADEGPGVAEENLDKIFRPFFRADASRSTVNSSFGLGLALAKRQISAVGGKIFATHNSPVGLLMRISLPRY